MDKGEKEMRSEEKPWYQGIYEMRSKEKRWYQGIYCPPGFIFKEKEEGIILPAGVYIDPQYGKDKIYDSKGYPIILYPKMCDFVCSPIWILPYDRAFNLCDRHYLECNPFGESRVKSTDLLDFVYSECSGLAICYLWKYNVSPSKELAFKDYLYYQIKNMEPIEKPMGDVTYVHDCGGLSHLELREVPKGTTHVTFINAENVRRVGDAFLRDREELTSIDLSGLQNVRSVGDDFLCYCTSLKSIDLSPLQNVRIIGDDFLWGCKSLTSLDLSPLQNVTSLSDYFMAYCPSLSSLDLSPLQNVTRIGDYFLRGCDKLTSIDLSGLQNVKRIGDNFLRGCDNLTSIDLSGLKNVTSIGDYFLAYCPSLTSIDLSPLKNVTSIRHRFLGRCKNLTLTKGQKQWIRERT